MITRGKSSINTNNLDLNLNYNVSGKKNRLSIDFNDLKYLKENFAKSKDKNYFPNNKLTSSLQNLCNSFFVFGKNSKQTNFNKNSLENKDSKKNIFQDIKRVNSVVKSNIILSTEISSILPKIELPGIRKNTQEKDNTKSPDIKTIFRGGSPVKVLQSYKKILNKKLKISQKNQIENSLRLVVNDRSEINEDRCNTETERKLYK
jgi:hypothetical protein